MSAPGNTRVVEQKALQQFREEMSEKVKDPYTVIMRSKKLPMALLSNPYEVCIDVCVCVCVCVCVHHSNLLAYASVPSSPARRAPA